MKDLRHLVSSLILISSGFLLNLELLSQDQLTSSAFWCDTLPILKIGLITDPQYCDCDPAGNRYFRETLNKLPRAVDTLNQYQVDFVMNLGDMIDRYENSYDSVIQFYHELTMPYYNLLGNHEFSEISEIYMDSILQRYEMPYYYYDFSNKNWRFLVLDGTELAEYSRYLHPELADEGDSLWQQVQGNVNAQPWNGGISRNQQLWMRSKLQEALDAEQNVILFCHFPVYPDSMRLRLWNDSIIVSLLEGYPNVVAYINGHEHNGDYGYRNGIHYYTQKAMVDFPDENSFSILEIYAHEIRLIGFGNVADTVLFYSDIKKKPLIFNLSDSILYYSHHTGSCIGKFLPDTSHTFTEIVYSLDISDSEYPYFAIHHDSLFLDTETDISSFSNIQITVVATGCEFDTTVRIFQLTFDTASVYFHYQLADTLLSVYDPYSIVLDSFLTDHSRSGLDYTLISSDSSVISTLITDSAVHFLPIKVGSSDIEFYVTDMYRDKFYLQRFLIEVYDPLNHPPQVNDTSELEMFLLLFDTVRVDLNELFFDPDGDDLTYGFKLGDTITFAANLKDSVLSIYAGSLGYTQCELTADDHRGGISTQILKLMVNQNPVRTSNYQEYVFPYEVSICPEFDLDTIYSDPDNDTLEYFITGSFFPFYIVDETILEICPENAGAGKIWLEITDHKNGLLLDTITFRFDPGSVSIEPFNNPAALHDVYFYPNPSEGRVSILINERIQGNIRIVLLDLSGTVIQELFMEKYSADVFHFSFSIDEDVSNGIYVLQITSLSNQFSISRIALLR